MKLYKTMDNGVQLIEYDDSIADAVADMWNKSGDSWGGNNEIMTAENVISTHSGGSFFNTFVAMYNDEAVGYCTFDRYYKDADTLYVHTLNVRPDFHGEKIGKELVLLCVHRTIELGYPRLDIHTWPGNTKAVPLYKKCGFLWEDRADTTHLSNFIPTVLKTELCGEFFQDADWYADSNRNIEIVPDGMKINKFEVYGYSWVKNGKHLAVGFEKTGRRIRYMETADFKIEFMAVNHELAFGLSYKCSFKVENKSGKELRIKISGKNDKGIIFNYNADEYVKDTAEFSGDFLVEAITEELDIWRVHPSVVADVYVNDRHAEFGLGIEPKFPLTVKLIEKRAIAKAGLIEDIHVNIKSSLNQRATVRFTLPDNSRTRFYENSFAVEMTPNGSATVSTRAELLEYGYEKINITYTISLDEGGEIIFTKPMSLINQGIDGMFGYENDNEYGVINGLWKLCLNKQNNHASFSRISSSGTADFDIPKLGKPYSDEFNLAKPADVRICAHGPVMCMEADFESVTFPGAVLTEIYTINASGVITRRHRSKNNSQTVLSLHLLEELWTSVGRRSVFHYDGGIQELRDDMTYGFSNVHVEKIDENWIFDATPHNKSGVCWPAEYNPQARWGGMLIFEHDLGKLAPGEIFETKPLTYISGLFNSVKDFRNYALGINEEIPPYTDGYLDIVLNNRNPIIAPETTELVVKNNRLIAYEGDLRLTSPDGLFSEAVQTNPPKRITEANTFSIALGKPAPGIYTAELELNFQSFSRKHSRVMFIPDRKGSIHTDETDGILTVRNGKLSFKVSPGYSNALYSMKYGDNEWLFSKFPVVEPYSWWNPFIGGIQSQLPQMSNRLVLREKITAEFVTVVDNFGSIWAGTKSVVSVNEFDEHRGMTYAQYYLTLPSLPVICYFVKLMNNSGEYKETELYTSAFISGRENLNNIYANIKNTERDEYRLRMGGEDMSQDFNKLAVISYGGKCAREEKLYVYSDVGRDNGNIRLGGDLNFLEVNAYAKMGVPNGGSYTTRPIFFIPTEKELTLESLTDLERIVF